MSISVLRLTVVGLGGRRGWVRQDGITFLFAVFHNAAAARIGRVPPYPVRDRRLIADKFGSKHRKYAGRPRIGPELASLSRWFWRAVTSALLAVALACQRRFNPFFLARLQIESVPLDFFDNVLLKDLTLEAPERVLNCFTVLNVDLSQTITSFMANDETSMLTVPRCPTGCVASEIAL